ncbi:hypothetical protein FSP39_006978 [Pinctada imbricata]|uniref:PH domain-containing protein n=1 Tax=Pinctada imbricata TaxID=66713 RepID=A0AA89C500_PINIB|nr:hypothetical protein FSP39_006978 [Pinctada imbricata]
MRFNHKELACLAESGDYDKEGVLHMKEKQEGLFKKGEVYVRRFFRLKGNLLFYYKDKEVLTEPVGVLVLERCTIELDVDSDIGNGFCIVYEGEDYVYKLQAQSEEVRDDWVQTLHMASYECLKMQLQSLREQIQAKTGRDPITQPPPTETGMEYEIASGCENLPCDSSSRPPNPFIVVNTIIPPQQNWIQHNNTEVVEVRIIIPPQLNWIQHNNTEVVEVRIIIPPQQNWIQHNNTEVVEVRIIIPPQQNWIQHNNTEVVEESNNPQFLKTIGFGDSKGVDTCTRVRITVYHVKERMTGTMSQLGQAVFTLQDVLMAPGMRLRIALQGSDPVDSGHVTVMAWINDPGLSVVQKKESSAGDEKQRSVALKRRSKRVETLRPMYSNIVTRSFRFDTNNSDVKLLVHEYMGESKVAFDIPAQLLKLWVEEEKRTISLLQEMGRLPSNIESEQVAQITISATIVSQYTDKLNVLANYSGPLYKQSTKKGDKELEFIPVNLHLQRMTVINEDKNTTGWYDIITVGAFTAYAQKYKQGGLKRLLNQMRDSYTPDSTLSKVTKMERACGLVNFVYDSRESINRDCDKLCQIATSGTGQDLMATMDLLAEKVRELVTSCDTPILQNIADEFQELKDEQINRMNSSVQENNHHLSSGDLSRSKHSDKSDDSEQHWRWSGSNFVKSPTIEPWEMTRLNVEAAVMCVMSIAEDLVKNKSGPQDRTNWLNDISPAVIKLKGFVELVYKRVLLFMTFLQVKECKENTRLMHLIKYRRDVCFAHALTSAVTGFLTKLSTSIEDLAFFEQVAKVGILMQFEGLLSCHSDEMCMIEDMVVAVDDLSHVTFKLTKSASPEDSPVVTLDGHCICVEIPIQEDSFHKLPEGLQKGDLISITPVFFNVGINEQASLAEKLGDTSLQERTNADNVAKVFSYIEKYQKEIGDPDNGRTGPNTMANLTQKLHYNTMTKKSKNTEILKLSAEICRTLKGIRYTSCKSAKDRTAMSVTLEQVNILQQSHDLAPHVFSQALDCFRSEGVRRENAAKNVGVRKYAFNSFQLLYVPKLYRPPNGTYGNVQG